MYRLGYILFFIIPILNTAYAQNSKEDEHISVLNNFLQQIENECQEPVQCRFTDEELKQIVKECKYATRHLNSSSYPNLELCQTYELSDAEIDNLLNQYIAFLENNSDDIQQLAESN